MKLKCPECNSCFVVVWRGNRRFFMCDFCESLYDLAGTELRRVSHVEMSKDRNGNYYVVKVNYYDTEERIL